MYCIYSSSRSSTLRGFLVGAIALSCCAASSLARADVVNVYTPATAEVASTDLDFGIVHVGDTVGQGALHVTNIAQVTDFNDVLRGSLGGAAAPFTASGTLGTGLAAGQTDSTSLRVDLNTSVAGIFNGAATASFVSHDASHPDLSLDDVAITLFAQVNNHALASFVKMSGAGSFNSDSLVLDFGTLSLGAGSAHASLGIRNDVEGPADDLGGDFELSAPDFSLFGFSAFDGIEAGRVLAGLSILFNPSAVGVYNGLVTLRPFESNRSGYSGSLPDLTLRLHAAVVEGGPQPVPEPGTLLLVATGLAAGLWLRRRKAVASGS